MVTFDQITEARERINAHVYKTPLEFSKQLSDTASNVFLKLECQQKLHSFKIRGALNKLLSLTPEERAAGVITSSSGNHGAGLSYAGRLTGMNNVYVYAPTTTPASKVENIRYYGANVRLVGENYDEAHLAVEEALKHEQMVYVDSSSDVEVIAGQGTIGLEILEQNPDIDTILVPIGGGGIITGIAIAAKRIKPGIKVYGVQTSACPAMAAALRDNVCYLQYPSEESICDALIGGVTEIPFEMAGQCIDDILLVQEDTIKAAIRLLLTKEKIVAEPAGAVVVAAIMENKLKGNIAAVVTGGNLDERIMKEVLGA